MKFQIFYAHVHDHCQNMKIDDRHHCQLEEHVNYYYDCWYDGKRRRHHHRLQMTIMIDWNVGQVVDVVDDELLLTRRKKNDAVNDDDDDVVVFVVY